MMSSLFEGKLVEEFQGKYRFLSNFYPCKIVIDCHEFDSVEHAYQAYKWNFVYPSYRDEAYDSIRKFVSSTGITAAQAKRMGKGIPVKPDIFDLGKVTMMKELTHIKYRDNPELRELLKATRFMRLEEGNKWGDRFWGVDLDTGKGMNVLGQVLMEERSNCIFHDELIDFDLASGSDYNATITIL